MGKQKDMRHVQHTSHKKKDKKFEKTVRSSRISYQENYLKNVEVVVQAELESAATTKKIGRKVRKELDRYPLLAKAAFLGCERVVDNILEAGENVNLALPDGSTPLILAVENGYPGIVQKLLKKGADPKLLRQDGRNALMLAVAKNDNRSFTLIWNYWDKNNFWELNNTDSQGYTALTIAVELGNYQITNFLLSLNGIELDKQTTEGKTALMFAVSGGQVNIVQKLLSSGSDFFLEDKNGATAICLAISQNQRDIRDLFYECLDSKAREVYVKKRIELLTRPRSKDISTVTTFYKDILFRVLLEIRKSFEGSVILLEKYSVLASLYKCLDTYQQDMDLLRIGFHLTACLIYDKAEFSRYVAEELAEQYVGCKFADFTLKIMQNYRMKSMTDLRGAAFQCIHAGIQCRNGKTWLKANYFQLLPFVKEFKVILGTLTFWADGESTKAKIMFDRFLESFNLVEKDFKPSCSPEAKNNIGEPVTVSESVDKNSESATETFIDTAATSDSGWQIVSKTGSKKDPKIVGNQKMPSLATKKDSKMKNKKLKLKTKLQNKIAAKKLGQRTNQKSNTELGNYFPNLSSDKKTKHVCYADALKKNLKNEDISNQDISKDNGDILSNYQVWTQEKTNNLPEIELDYEIKRPNLIATKTSDDEKTNINLNSSDCRNINDNEQKNTGSFYQPTNLMTFLTNLFISKEKKKSSSNQNTHNNTIQLEKNDLETIAKDSHKKQNEALRDIFAALGLKADSKQDGTIKSKTITNNESETAANVNYTNTLNDEDKKTVKGEFLYSDCFKHASRNESKTMENVQLKSSTNVHAIKGTDENMSVVKDIPISSVFTNENRALDNDMKNIREENEKMMSGKTVEELKDCPFKNCEIQSTITNSSSSAVENLNEIADKKDFQFFNSNFNSNHGISTLAGYLKRKNPETYFRDIYFDFFKEEIKEVNETIFERFSYRLLEFNNVNKCLMKPEKVGAFSRANMTKNENVMLHETDLFPKTNFNIFGLFSSKFTYFNRMQKASSNYFNVDLNANRNINKENSTRFQEKNLEMITMNNIPNRIHKDKAIFNESRSVLRLAINENFSNFEFNFYKRKKNSRYLRIQPPLSTEKSLILSDITFRNIQKLFFLYKRLLFHGVENKSYQSVLPMNTCPGLHQSNLEHSFTEKHVTQDKILKKYENFPCKITKIKNLENSFAVREEYNTLKEFKTEISKIISYLSMKPAKILRKSLKHVREKEKGVIKDIRSVKEKNAELESYKKTNSTDNSFVLHSETYGYKPNFINCEKSSKWYEKLHKIEACVPLSSFLLGFGQTAAKSVTNLHEIVSATGKIVFSSKEEHILKYGDFGTYIGLMSNGNPVVVKMFQRTEMGNIDLFYRKRQLQHKNLVLFYCLCNPWNDKRNFAVTELVEFSLPEYMKTKIFNFDKCHLIRDLLHAIQYLHEKRIVHGFLKPNNIMVTIDDRLKVSDFYQLGMRPIVCGIVNRHKNNPAPIGTSAISDFCWRPYELISATVEKDARILLTKASDMQMTGMLMYCILSGGKHPFGSYDLRCQENIRDGCPEFGPRPSDIESRDLIRDMIKRTPSKRLNIQQALKHPYLWNSERRMQFLVQVARKIDFYTWKPTKIAEALQDSCIEARDWTCYIQPEILNYVSKWMHKVYTNNYADLLHFILSINDNFEILPEEIKSYMVHPSFLISRTFPTFFMSVYCVVRDIPVVQGQMSLEAYFY